MDRELYSTQPPAAPPAVPPAAPLTTLTLLRFSGLARVWMLSQMAFARRPLRDVHGLRFWKLLGTGDRFSLRPDLNCYGLLAVWQTEADADAFFAASPVMRAFRQRAEETWTVKMLALQSHGAWSGANPFLPATSHRNRSLNGSLDGSLVVLTRATIRWSRLVAFWSSVPNTNDAVSGAPGLLLSIGIGEAPIVRQATFSIWRSEADMRAFAYRTPVHAEVIRRTRDESWYAEELFARFAPVASVGTWGGYDPLRGLP